MLVLISPGTQAVSRYRFADFAAMIRTFGTYFPASHIQVNNMRGPGAPASLLFKLIVPATAVFIVTVMSLIAVVFSDPRAPVAKFLNTYGTTLLVVEFLAVIGLSLLAMTVDRIRTLRELHKSSKENTEAQSGK